MQILIPFNSVEASLCFMHFGGNMLKRNVQCLLRKHDCKHELGEPCTFQIPNNGVGNNKISDILIAPAFRDGIAFSPEVIFKFIARSGFIASITEVQSETDRIKLIQALTATKEELFNTISKLISGDEHYERMYNKNNHPTNKIEFCREVAAVAVTTMVSVVKTTGVDISDYTDIIQMLKEILLDKSIFADVRSHNFLDIDTLKERAMDFVNQKQGEYRDFKNNRALEIGNILNAAVGKLPKLSFAEKLAGLIPNSTFVPTDENETPAHRRAKNTILHQQSDIARLKEKNAQLTRDAKQLKAENYQFAQSYQILQKTSDNIQANYNFFKAKYDAYNVVLEEKKEKLDHVKDSENKIIDKVSVAIADKNAPEDNFLELANELKEARLKITEYEETVSRLESNIKSLNEQQASDTKQVQDLLKRVGLNAGSSKDKLTTISDLKVKNNRLNVMVSYLFNYYQISIKFFNVNFFVRNPDYNELKDIKREMAKKVEKAKGEQVSKYKRRYNEISIECENIRDKAAEDSAKNTKKIAELEEQVKNERKIASRYKRTVNELQKEKLVQKQIHDRINSNDIISDRDAKILALSNEKKRVENLYYRAEKKYEEVYNEKNRIQLDSDEWRMKYFASKKVIETKGFLLPEASEEKLNNKLQFLAGDKPSKKVKNMVQLTAQNTPSGPKFRYSDGQPLEKRHCFGDPTVDDLTGNGAFVSGQLYLPHPNADIKILIDTVTLFQSTVNYEVDPPAGVKNRTPRKQYKTIFNNVLTEKQQPKLEIHEALNYTPNYIKKRHLRESLPPTPTLSKSSSIDKHKKLKLNEKVSKSAPDLSRGTEGYQSDDRSEFSEQNDVTDSDDGSVDINDVLARYKKSGSNENVVKVEASPIELSTPYNEDQSDDDDNTVKSRAKNLIKLPALGTKGVFDKGIIHDNETTTQMLKRNNVGMGGARIYLSHLFGLYKYNFRYDMLSTIILTSPDIMNNKKIEIGKLYIIRVINCKNNVSQTKFLYTVDILREQQCFFTKIYHKLKINSNLLNNIDKFAKMFFIFSLENMENTSLHLQLNPKKHLNATSGAQLITSLSRALDFNLHSRNVNVYICKSYALRGNAAIMVKDCAVDDLISKTRKIKVNLNSVNTVITFKISHEPMIVQKMKLVDSRMIGRDSTENLKEVKICGINGADLFEIASKLITFADSISKTQTRFSIENTPVKTYEPVCKIYFSSAVEAYMFVLMIEDILDDELHSSIVLQTKFRTPVNLRIEGYCSALNYSELSFFNIIMPEIIALSDNVKFYYLLGSLYENNSLKFVTKTNFSINLTRLLSSNYRGTFVNTQQIKTNTLICNFVVNADQGKHCVCRNNHNWFNNV